MNPEEYLDRLIEKREAGEKRFSVRNDEIANSLAAAETLMQLQKIDVPPAFAHRLESSIRTRIRSQRLTRQNGQSIPTGPLHRHANPHRSPGHISWAATAIAAILVLAFTALVATYTGSLNLSGSPAAGLKPVENQITSTVAATPPNLINGQIMQLHNAIVDLNTMVTDGRNDNTIQQALTSVSTSTIDCQKAVAALPEGTERDAEQQNLNSVLAEENQILRNLLNHVDWPLRLDFTRQLGSLGEAVPDVTHGIIHTQSNGTLLITLTGTHFAPHAALIVDGRAIGIVTQSTSWQLIAVISRSNWSSGTHDFGILNPDGTAAQMVLRVGNSGHDE